MPILIFLLAIGFIIAIVFFTKPESLPPYLQAIRIGLRAFLIIIVILSFGAGFIYWWSNRVTLKHDDLVGSWIIGVKDYDLILHENNGFYLQYEDGQIDKGKWSFDENSKTLFLEAQETTAKKLQKQYQQFTIVRGSKSYYALDAPDIYNENPFTKSISSFGFDKDYEKRINN